MQRLLLNKIFLFLGSVAVMRSGMFFTNGRSPMTPLVFWSWYMTQSCILLFNFSCGNFLNRCELASLRRRPTVRFGWCLSHSAELGQVMDKWCVVFRCIPRVYQRCITKYYVRSDNIVFIAENTLLFQAMMFANMAFLSTSPSQVWWALVDSAHSHSASSAQHRLSAHNTSLLSGSKLPVCLVGKPCMKQ